MDEDIIYSRDVFKRNLKNVAHKATFNAFHEIKKPKKTSKRRIPWHLWRYVVISLIVLFLLGGGGMMLWIATLRMPDLQSFQDKILTGSTKIYDRTGQILLYDLNQNTKRQVVPFDKISQNIKNATISIEDDKFYQHSGIELTSILRAVIVDVEHLSLSQGGSTITQQVIKNALLNGNKTIARKIEEWVLAIKLDKMMSKDDILNLYLNGSPYGGSIYGVEEASETYFGKPASDLDVAQSAYLAALPNAPSYYSPYGNHLDALNTRKNLVLSKMKDGGYITEADYTTAKNEKVVFSPPQDHSIKAPHFVMFIKDYLVQKYGEDEVDNGNLKVVTTLDYDLQQKAENIVKTYALANEQKFNATNAALIAIDPTTGQILSMVGSRDYFDKKIDGQFNVTLAHRQPGSAFKPFVYATAWEKGYTPDTVLFDVPTQFSTTCDADGNKLSADAVCYMPQNYDEKFLGPISMRNAIAQSRNIPSIKTLYLAGINDSIQTAKDMGITSLTGGANQYGLTLVLGGGEVSPLEITSAYGVFADNGIRNPYTGILSVTDKDGNTLEQFTADPQQVIPEQTALQMNDVLSDNTARLPLNGLGSATDFPGSEQVALKTGTTNDYRDVWTIGYTPSIAVGAWAGNNDNSVMVKKTSGLIIAPLWRAFMDEALKKYPPTPFMAPDPVDPTLRPILRGVWEGNQVYTIDKISGKLATADTPPEMRLDKALPNVHTILYWVNKNDPKGAPPTNPGDDPQFKLWEKPVLAWAAVNMEQLVGQAVPNLYDDVHSPLTAPKVTITSPIQNAMFNPEDTVNIKFSDQGKYPLTQAEYYINGALIGTVSSGDLSFSFVPQDVQSISSDNTLHMIVRDSVGNEAEATTSFTVNQ